MFSNTQKKLFATMLALAITPSYSAANTETQNNITLSASILSTEESKNNFNLNLYEHNICPVKISIKNDSDEDYIFSPRSVQFTKDITSYNLGNKKEQSSTFLFLWLENLKDNNTFTRDFIVTWWLNSAFFIYQGVENNPERKADAFIHFLKKSLFLVFELKILALTIASRLVSGFYQSSNLWESLQQTVTMENITIPSHGEKEAYLFIDTSESNVPYFIFDVPLYNAEIASNEPAQTFNVQLKNFA